MRDRPPTPRWFPWPLFGLTLPGWELGRGSGSIVGSGVGALVPLSTASRRSLPATRRPGARPLLDGDGGAIGQDGQGRRRRHRAGGRRLPPMFQVPQGEERNVARLFNLARRRRRLRQLCGRIAGLFERGEKDSRTSSTACSGSRRPTAPSMRRTRLSRPDGGDLRDRRAGFERIAARHVVPPRATLLVSARSLAAARRCARAIACLPRRITPTA